MGKRALVTGSSRGIGRAVALALAGDGYEVIVHGASDSPKLWETKTMIEQNGGVATVEIADLCDLGATAALGQRIGNVDVLVLNASVQFRTPWQEITAEACQKQLNCNFVSSMLLIQACVPHMKEKKWGRIVTIGSVQEAKPHPDMLIYSSIKAAQTAMEETIDKFLEY